MTRLLHPEWLAAVLALTLATGLALDLARWRARRRQTRLGVAGPTAPAERDLALLVATAALGMALLGPRLGEPSATQPVRGVDVVFLVDVSRSMDARDVPPSRLVRARRAVESLLERLHPGDRAALAAFGERGVLLTPLTPDRDALAELLSALDTDLIHPAGSNLGAGVEAALEAFEAGGERPGVVFVLSDGEDPEARRELGAAAARRAGVRVVAAALGTEAGAGVPDRGAPLREASGRTVVTRRRAERLARLADATAGEILRADAWGALDWGRALAAIRREGGGAAGGEATLRLPAVSVLPFAGAAFALLLIEVWPPAGGRARRRRTAALALVACLGLGSGPAPDAELRQLEAGVAARPHEPRALLRLGVARLAREDAAGARRAFAAAAAYARDPALAALAYYDLGVAWLESGDPAAARDAFLDALALAPDDARARFNLELAVARLAERPPAAAKPAPRLPRPEASAAAEPQRPMPEVPSDAQRQRLLERVVDDPARALAQATGPSPRRGAAEPVW